MEQDKVVSALLKLKDGQIATLEYGWDGENYFEIDGEWASNQYLFDDLERHKYVNDITDKHNVVSVVKYNQVWTISDLGKRFLGYDTDVQAYYISCNNLHDCVNYVKSADDTLKRAKERLTETFNEHLARVYKINITKEMVDEILSIYKERGGI